MHMRRGRFLVKATVLLMVLCVLGIGTAYAVEVEEYGAKYMRADDPSMIDVDIVDFKVRLYELGFYSAGVSDSTLQTRELDDLTMAAVKLVCTYNPDLTYYADGVSNVLYWRVMGLVDGGLATPLDEIYRTLEPGCTDDAVTKVQNRLNQLGYDAEGEQFTPGVYDDQLQSAVDAFVRCNKFVYERENGITVELQELLFSDSAQRYFAEETDKGSAADRIFGYLTAQGNVMGVALPNYALLLIGFAMLCVIALLALKLFTPGPEKAKKEKNVQTKKLREGEVRFKVEYGSESYVYTSNMKNYVRIGRATGDFPLNMADESVSRKHCEICCENGVMMLRDFSSYGTAVNGEICHHSQHVLHSGDVIEVGRHRIEIEFQSRNGGQRA